MPMDESLWGAIPCEGRNLERGHVRVGGHWNDRITVVNLFSANYRQEKKLFLVTNMKQQYRSSFSFCFDTQNRGKTIIDFLNTGWRDGRETKKIILDFNIFNGVPVLSVSDCWLLSNVYRYQGT